MGAMWGCEQGAFRDAPDVQVPKCQGFHTSKIHFNKSASYPKFTYSGFYNTVAINLRKMMPAGPAGGGAGRSPAL